MRFSAYFLLKAANLQKNDVLQYFQPGAAFIACKDYHGWFQNLCRAPDPLTKVKKLASMKHNQ